MIPDPTDKVVPDSALETLASGGLLAFPTETVWGLAAVARSTAAVERLQAWKGRDAAQPVSILIDAPERIPALGFEYAKQARRLAEAFWPGPLTLVLPALSEVSLAPGIARADGAVGFRCSPHPWANRLAQAAWSGGLGPLTATSLNRHGQPPARSHAGALKMVREREREAVEGGAVARVVVLEPGDADAFDEAPSSVLDLASDPPRLLREGAIATARLVDLLGSLEDLETRGR